MTIRRLFTAALLASTLGCAALAQEALTLTTPVFQSAGVTNFRVWGLYLKRAHPDSPAEILATLREVGVDKVTFVTNGKSIACHYEGAPAEALIVSLNTSNLSTLSLERRVIAKCQQDGKLGAGTIAGAPQ